MLAALAHAGVEPAGQRVAVQGFGTMGTPTARLLTQAGLKIVAGGRRAGFDGIEHLFDNGCVLDVAIRRLDGATVVDPALLSGGRNAPPLPVHPALAELLPSGLRRGSTVSVSGSISLLLATLGAASAGGAWCALIGFPSLSAEALAEYGLALSRVAVIPQPGSGWLTAVGALLDAVDLVVARPRRIAPGEVRRLGARARTRDAVLVTYLTGTEQWPGAELRLHARSGTGGGWSGIGAGTGRLRARRLEITATGRGRYAGRRSGELWLPADGGGVRPVDSLAHGVSAHGVSAHGVSAHGVSGLGEAGPGGRAVELAG